MADRGWQIAPYGSVRRDARAGTPPGLPAPRPAGRRVGRRPPHRNGVLSPVGRSLDAARAHVAAGNFDFEALAAILEMPSPLGRAFGDTSGPARSGTAAYGLLARWTLDPLLARRSVRDHAHGAIVGREPRRIALQLARLSASSTRARSGCPAMRRDGRTASRAPTIRTATPSSSAAPTSARGPRSAHVSKQLDSVAAHARFRIAARTRRATRWANTSNSIHPRPTRSASTGQMDLFACRPDGCSGPHPDRAVGTTRRSASNTNGAPRRKRGRVDRQLSQLHRRRPRTARGKSPPVDQGTHWSSSEIGLVFAWRPVAAAGAPLNGGRASSSRAAKTIMAPACAATASSNGSNKHRDGPYAYAQVTLNVP